MRKLTVVIATLGMLVAPAQAWTYDGYMTSGGVGRVKCAVFQNTIAEARAAGMNTQRGIILTNPFVQYAYGFYTQYNASSPGIYDLLDGVRGDDMHISLMTISDNWCRDNPTKDFDDAVVNSIGTLLPTAKIEAPK